MALMFYLLFLLSCTSSVLCTTIGDDGAVLLKIKQQLGNPAGLSPWVKGLNFCDHVDLGNSYVTCTSTGHVRTLLLYSLFVNTSFPNAICHLTEIEELRIEFTPGLSGPIPSCITKLPNLRVLIIMDTSFSGSLPKFRNHTNIKVILLSGNKLSGTIPKSYSTCPNLIGLDVSSNFLTGTIPPNLVVPGRISILMLANNNLTGRVPKSYGSGDFNIISFANNQLRGDASFLFGKQKKTPYIILANNEFQFDLSRVEFSDDLYQLDISHNKIYGRVPNSFATAASLSVADLSFNRLCGPLPQGGNMWQFNATVFENNACLCGNPLPPCTYSPPTSAVTPVSQPPL